MILLDTSYIISLFRGDPEIASVTEIVDNDDPILSTVSHFEIFRAQQKMGNKEQTFFYNLFAFYQVISFNISSSEKASEIQSNLDKIGHKVNAFDVLIAGTMLGHGIFKIVTLDSDFDIIRKVTDIEVIIPKSQ